MTEPRWVPAPAKVNLGLRVLGRREDGYHDLESVVVTLGPEAADHLRILAVNDAERFRTLALSLEVTGVPELTQGVPRDESNLALRAASALAERIAPRGFAEIELEKRVPTAAGLGGGSADAAAVLRVLNDLWGGGLDEQELGAVAAEVGSDVPALLAGGAVAVRGRGDRVESVRAPTLRLVVATFGFGVRTADAFEWWDRGGVPTGPSLEALLTVLRDPAGEGDGVASRLGPLLRNDLQAEVVRRHPEVGLALGELTGLGATGAIMTGSGPTVFGLLPGTEPPPSAGLGALRRLTGRDPMVVSTTPGKGGR